jgi:putative aldouronate transport system permease protein
MSNKLFTNIYHKKRSAGDWILDILVYSFSFIVLILTLYPFYYILVVSFNEGLDASAGGIYFWPRKFTLENYHMFFSDIKWIKGIGITVTRTLIGTTIGVFFTTLVAYGLSFPNLLFKKYYMLIIVISMYFSGGIIPYYTLLNQLHLINNFAVYIIPGALNTFFIMIAMSFFADISPSLRESATLDGASEIKVFLKIILPISKPFIATLILFIGVGHWNNWYDSAFFIQDKNLKTLSYLMMEVVNKTMISSTSANYGASSSTTTVSIQSAAMIVATLPIVCVYPFLQKYFVKGIMVGSVKE